MVACLIVSVLSALAGIVAWVGVRHWPRADPAAAAGRTVAEELAHHRSIRRFLHSRFDPKVATGLALTAALGGLAVTGAIIGVVVYMVRTNSGLVNVDVHIARWAASNVHGSALRTMSRITWLGSTPVILIFALAGTAFGIWRYRKPSILLFLTIVVGGQFGLMNLIKFTVERARPDIRPSAVFSGSSFPSGHSTASAATFAALALVLGLRSPANRRALLMAGAVTIAVAVACSRVLLGVHWFSDAVAGLALGWSWFAFCAVAFGGSLLTFAEPVEEAAVAPPSAGAVDALRR